MDLEWDTVYSPKIRGFLNEIIEIGAVKLDDSLCEIDTFSVLVRSQLGRSLSPYIAKLTTLTEGDLAHGQTFQKAHAALRGWIGGGAHILLTWSDTDLRVLLANTRHFLNDHALSYVQNYCDVQRYFQHRLALPTSRQVGLASAGELLDLPTDGLALHRALDDSRYTAQCFARIFDASDFEAHVHPCNADFLAELEYKPRYISDINSPLVDKKQLFYICRDCGRPAHQQTDWRFGSRGFNAEFWCPKCKQRVRAMVSFKKKYSTVEIKRSARLITPKENEGQEQHK
jgi:DNA polymerase III epsilon subunit-like protein